MATIARHAVKLTILALAIVAAVARGLLHDVRPIIVPAAVGHPPTVKDIDPPVIVVPRRNT